MKAEPTEAVQTEFRSKLEYIKKGDACQMIKRTEYQKLID